MPNATGDLHQVAEVQSDEVTNSVRIELALGVDIDSIVLAYRDDGELVELAERSAPASAELSGELE